MKGLYMGNSLIYKNWVNACQLAGLPAIRRDTCHKILAVVYVYGGSMEFVYNKKLMADIQYAQKTLNLHGTGTPDVEDIEAIKGYINKIESFYATAQKKDLGIPDEHPGWVCDMMKERYDITQMRL